MIVNHILIHDIIQGGIDVYYSPVSHFITSGLAPAFCIDMTQQSDGSWRASASRGVTLTVIKAKILDRINEAITCPGGDHAA